VVPPPLTRWLVADFEDSPATYHFLADCTTLDNHRAIKAIMAKTLYGTVAILPAAVAQITREDMLQYLTMAQLVFTVGSTRCALLGRLLGPLYDRVSPTPILPWPTTLAAYRRVFLDRGYSIYREWGRWGLWLLFDLPISVLSQLGVRIQPKPPKP
jgi:hypothetical protein